MSQTTNPEVVAVTFCKNERNTIRQCISSVLNQTVPPISYVVVDDGSSDGTGEVIRSIKSEILHPVFLEPESANRLRGEHKIKLLLKGVVHASRFTSDWHFLLNVDADCILARNFLESLIGKMEENERLGIASGTAKYVVDGRSILEKKLPRHPHNAARLYRKKCWTQLRTIPCIPGWDSWIVYESIRNGWDVGSFDSTSFIEKRPYGTGKIPSSPSSLFKYPPSFWAHIGSTRNILGSHPLQMVAWTTRKLKDKPYITGSMIMLMSYLIHRLVGNRPLDEEYYTFVRNLYLNGLRERVLRRLSSLIPRTRKKMHGS